MKRVIFAGLLVWLTFQGYCSAEPCQEWNELQALVRDGLLQRAEARSRVEELHRKLLDLYGRGRDLGQRSFPLEGGTWRDIGGRGGDAFVARGYDFYRGNSHAGHPAHDIFIPDRDQDSRHDRTGKPVSVLAFASGVVVATNAGWVPGSKIRGGNYVWVFSPAVELYCYYAHLQDVLVQVGQWVRAGETLGTVGRSGKNAYPRRSPTHLHFMCLCFDQGRMTPYNPYPELLRLGGK